MIRLLFILSLVNVSCIFIWTNYKLIYDTEQICFIVDSFL